MSDEAIANEGTEITTASCVGVAAIGMGVGSGALAKARESRSDGDSRASSENVAPSSGVGAVLRLFGTVDESIVDGPGLRFAVFVQGCPHHCEGCHNPGSWPFEGGTVARVADLVEQVRANPLVTGVTLSGGEPFSQCAGCLALVRTLKREGYDVWAYSGYRYEDLASGAVDPLAPMLLEQCDVLVDGPFMRELSSYDLPWKGSSNQRVIDLARTRTERRIVLWANEALDFEKPASW